MSKPDPFWLDQAGRKQLKLCTVQQIKYNLVIKIFCLLSMQQNNGSGKSCKEESNSLQAKPTVIYIQREGDCDSSNSWRSQKHNSIFFQKGPSPFNASPLSKSTSSRSKMLTTLSYRCLSLVSPPVALCQAARPAAHLTTEHAQIVDPVATLEVIYKSGEIIVSVYQNCFHPTSLQPCLKKRSLTNQSRPVVERGCHPGARQLL